MPEQRNKYNIPHLKVSLEATFTAMTRAYKKAFIFRQGNCTMNALHPFLSKSFALSIWSTDSKKNHDCSFEDNYCVLFVKLKFLIPTLRHMFCSRKSSKIYGETDFLSSVSRNSRKKYTFLWFKKRDFYF